MVVAILTSCGGGCLEKLHLDTMPYQKAPPEVVKMLAKLGLSGIFQCLDSIQSWKQEGLLGMLTNRLSSWLPILVYC